MAQQYGQLDLFARIADTDPAVVRDFAALLERRAQAPAQVALRAQYLDLLRLRPGQRVLEVGCGGAPVVRALAARVAPDGLALGLDPGRPFLAAARALAAADPHRARIALQAGDARALPYADRSFDVVLAVTTLHHVPDATRALAEMVRVARPGGRMCLVENDSDSAIIAHPDRALTRRIVAAYSDQTFTDSWLARRAPGLLADLGLAEIQIRAFMAVETDPAGWFATLTTYRAEAALQAGAITVEERDHWLSQLRAEQQAGRFLASQTTLCVWGTRPPC